MTDKNRTVENILKEYDRGTDRGKSFELYYQEIFEIYYEKNCFECER